MGDPTTKARRAGGRAPRDQRRRTGTTTFGMTAHMAKGRSTPQGIPDAVRDAVERTIQATVGSAQQTRGRAQGAVDDLVERAEASAEQVRQRVRGTRPVTHDELDEIHRDMRALGRRLDAIEKRLPKPRKPTGSRKAASSRGSTTSRKRSN
jgi:hypothetical protein